MGSGGTPVVRARALVVIMAVAETCRSSLRDHAALSSSPIHPVLGHLADLAGDAAEDPPGLLAVLARVADPGTGGGCATGWR